ncbi:ABC transporter substrate-binding protein [Siccibacter turicensis]|uniref:ABC transporter substrate-binding protein n=1 Tax=Siccibacter turicensis TaxID=357233 RepID=UPI00101F5B28|nr:ABC transporter substrate-binding protein [Siccibacter turicensis]MDY0970017.1 ABC transporter substrate-binding protein [Siccibacter turicensis]
MTTRFVSLLCAAALLSVFAPAHARPVTIENCGVTTTWQQPPARVVTIGQHETELLLALGLKEKIVGTAVWFGALPPALQADGKGLKRLAENAPGFEAVVAQRPDLVAAQYTYHVGDQGEVATRQQFEQLGIHTWIAPADCVGKSLTAGSNGDGGRDTPFTLDLIYQEIASLATLFDVEARGKALTDALQQRVAEARRTAQAAMKPEANAKVVFWFSSTRLNGDPWVAGSAGAPGWIARTLGLTNIINTREEWPAVSWETIARSDPDYLVLASMDRRLYPADDIVQKLAFLRNDPVTREMKAVKQNHIIVVPAMSLNPSLRNVDAVETIGQRIAAFHAGS